MTETETMPKTNVYSIAGVAKIKDCKIEAKGCKLNFEGLQLSPEQCEKISRIIQNEDAVTITIDPIQSEFDFEEE